MHDIIQLCLKDYGYINHIKSKIIQILIHVNFDFISCQDHFEDILLKTISHSTFLIIRKYYVDIRRSHISSNSSTSAKKLRILKHC